jgi:colanic acid biosynthesis glycosyl transferase WcaI
MIHHNKNSINLVFVHSLFYPDYSAGSQMLSDLAFYLAKKGMSITVITSRQIYDGSGVLLPRYEEINNVKIFRTWSTTFGRKTYVGRICDYLSLEVSLIFKLFRITKKQTIVILMTDPPLLNIIARPIIGFKGGKVVNWLQDLFPEVAVGAGVLKKSSFINIALTKLRNIALNRSANNIVIGHIMQDYLLKAGIDHKKILRIPNWADGSAIRPLFRDENSIRLEWGLKDKFIVGYSGSLGKAHDFSTFLSAIEQLQHESHICFLFIGGGVGMRQLEKHVFENKLKNVLFKPYQPREILHLTLSVADIHWVTLEPQMEGFIVPSKIYGILAAGRPIIFVGNKESELSIEVINLKCGVGVEIGDTESLVGLIKTYSTDIESIQKMGQCGREAFEELYDFPVSANKFYTLFNDMNSLNDLKNTQ